MLKNFSFKTTKRESRREINQCCCKRTNLFADWFILMLDVKLMQFRTNTTLTKVTKHLNDMYMQMKIMRGNNPNAVNLGKYALANVDL